MATEFLCASCGEELGPSWPLQMWGREFLLCNKCRAAIDDRWEGRLTPAAASRTVKALMAKRRLWKKLRVPLMDRMKLRTEWLEMRREEARLQGEKEAGEIAALMQRISRGEVRNE